MVGKCRIPELCVKRGISQSQLAELVGISKGRVSEYVSLQYLPGVLVAKNIAHYLNCSIEDLYDWELVSSSKREGQ
ncbi:helix-turn-helix transcriptional regulator [Metabacillus indicus]|uniref:helix-turn-helix transcriptional regulator n=1 Tax=Metabacillus indicus TaxID=246786 RepID=UPI003877F9D9